MCIIIYPFPLQGHSCFFIMTAFSAKLKPFATTFLHQTDRSCQKQCESLSVIHAKRKGTLFNNRSYTLIVGCI